MATIAVIEDEAQILSTLEELLTLAGHRVLTASDGQSGLRLIQAQLPDLVLCDVMLPRLDGYSVLTALRQDMSTVTLPVILLAARVERADQRQGMELGADDYITKPFTPDEVLRAITVRLNRQTQLRNQLSQVQQSLNETRRQLEVSQQQQEQSRKLAQLKDELLTKLLEDLGNPVSNINLAIRMLVDAATEEQRQQYLEVLRQECDREMQLLNEIAELQSLLTPEKAAILQRFNLLRPPS